MGGGLAPARIAQNMPSSHAAISAHATIPTRWQRNVWRNIAQWSGGMPVAQKGHSIKVSRCVTRSMLRVIGHNAHRIRGRP